MEQPIVHAAEMSQNAFPAGNADHSKFGFSEDSLDDRQQTPLPIAQLAEHGAHILKVLVKQGSLVWRVPMNA